MDLSTEYGHIIYSFLSSFFDFSVMQFLVVLLEKSVLTNIRIIRNLIIYFEKACG